LLQAERLAKFYPDGLKVVIVDEAHHAASPSYRYILSQFDSSIKNPKSDGSLPPMNYRVPIVGFSATFSRHDGLALGAVFDRIIYHRDFLEMIKEKWFVYLFSSIISVVLTKLPRLCNVRFTCVRANLNLKNVTINSRTGDYNPTSLAQVINTPTVNKLVFQTWLDRAGKVQV
jgi:ATP-dependent helicase IRC3